MVRLYIVFHTCANLLLASSEVESAFELEKKNKTKQKQCNQI